MPASLIRAAFLLVVGCGSDWSAGAATPIDAASDSGGPRDGDGRAAARNRATDAGRRDADADDSGQMEAGRFRDAALSADASKDSGEVDTTWKQDQELTATDGATNAYFAETVAMSGDTVVIGADSDDEKGTDSGSAYVFVRSGTTWRQQQKLTANDGAASDHFGRTVAIDSDTIIVGAYGDDDGGTRAGSAYVFLRSGTTWTQQQKLTASDGAAGDQFGWSVCVSGDTAIIGAYLDDDVGDASGSAYVFVRGETTWTEQQKLTASDGKGGDWFAFSDPAISGDTAVIGARWHDDAGSDSGAAYVFTRSGTSWTERQKLTASDGAASDWFGDATSVSGDTIVVGAPRHDDPGTNSGAVYVFARSGTTWTEQQKLTPRDEAEGDEFGFSVSISATTAIVGAIGDDDGADEAGLAYVFEQNGTTWTEQQKLTASNAAAKDWFGFSVSVSGVAAIISARNGGTGSNFGSAYIFRIQ